MRSDLRPAAGGASASEGSDAVGRYGGDEFLVVLGDTALPEARAIAERLVEAVRETCQSLIPGVPASASCGGAMVRDGDDAMLLIARADALVYEVKANGGNAVVLAP